MSEPVGHISSAVISVRPEDLEAVAARLGTLAGTEVHAMAGSRIVVVLEGRDARALADRLSEIAAMPEVHAAAMVFEQSIDSEHMDAA